MAAKHTRTQAAYKAAAPLIKELKTELARSRAPIIAVASYIGVSRTTLYAWLGGFVPMRAKYHDAVSRTSSVLRELTIKGELEKKSAGEVLQRLRRYG